MVLGGSGEMEGVGRTRRGFEMWTAHIKADFAFASLSNRLRSDRPATQGKSRIESAILTFISSNLPFREGYTRSSIYTVYESRESSTCSVYRHMSLRDIQLKTTFPFGAAIPK